MVLESDEHKTIANIYILEKFKDNKGLARYNYIGIDPGSRKVGICLVPAHKDHIVGIHLFVDKVEGRVERMKYIQSMINTSIIQAGYDASINIGDACSCLWMPPTVTIEGASFGAPHGQVELAEARAAIALLFSEKTKRVSIIPPSKIRKAVFGHGRIKNLWTNIPDDVAAAIGCAYYPLMLHQQ